MLEQMKPFIDLGTVHADPLVPRFPAKSASAWWADRHRLGPVDELLNAIRARVASSNLDGYRKVLVSRNRPTGYHTDSTDGYTLIVFLRLPGDGSGALELVEEKVFLAPKEPRAYLVDTNRPHRVWWANGERLVVVYYRPLGCSTSRDRDGK